MNLSLSRVFKNKYIAISSILAVIFAVIILTVIFSQAEGTAGITYRAHVAYNGWMTWVSDGSTAGTTGESRRMEGIKIKLTGDLGGDVVYQSYVRDVGWQNEVRNSETSGIVGESKQMEAIKIRLEGEVSEKYNILYRVHVKNKGWLEWVSNGAMAGSDTEALRIEAIEIKLEAKPEQDTGQYENNRGQVTTLSEEEYAIFVAIIFCESGSEPYEGKLGVANVILNRMYQQNKSLKDVVYAPKQFSPVQEGTLATRIAEFKAGQFTHPNHLECMEAADEAMAGHNNIGDRDGFMTPAAYSRQSGTSQRMDIGNHVFFKW